MMSAWTQLPPWLIKLVADLPDGLDWRDALTKLAHSAPPPGPVVLPPGPLMAWHAWAVTDDGKLTGLYSDPESIAWPSSGWDTAVCVYGPLFGQQHERAAPQATCFCGIHVIRDQGEMYAYMRARQHKVDRWALGPVQFRGPAFRPAFPAEDWWNEAGDPPTTLRVGRARLVGPLLLSKTAAPLRPALEARYGCVYVSGGPPDHVDEDGNVLGELFDRACQPASPPSNVWKAVESRGRPVPPTAIDRLLQAQGRIATYVRACEAIDRARRAGLISVA